MYRDADVTMIDTAWSARDGAALAEVGARVGVDLDLEALGRLNALVRRAGTGVRRRDLIATMLGAATGESGIATFEWDRWLCLAVRHGHQVTVGFARGSKISTVWPDLKPWLSNFPSNRKRLDPWAAKELPDRVTFDLREVPANVTTAPANADDLIRQIVENPHDRELRAVLADLLIEHDQIRGKLMRLQAEIDALPLQSDDRKKRELVVAQLVKQHGRVLAGEIADHAKTYTFAAGFVDTVTMTAAAFRDHGERLFRQQPIRRLQVQPANTAAVATLAKSPIGFLRELHFDAADYRRQVSFARLGDAAFDRLEVLELAGMAAIDDEDAFATLNAPRLRSLVIRTHVVATTLRGLARNRVVCDQLEELTIHPTITGPARVPGDNTIADEAFTALALPRLRTLTLYYCWFATPERIAQLRAPLLADVQVGG